MIRWRRRKVAKGTTSITDVQGWLASWHDGEFPHDMLSTPNNIVLLLASNLVQWHDSSGITTVPMSSDRVSSCAAPAEKLLESDVLQSCSNHTVYQTTLTLNDQRKRKLVVVQLQSNNSCSSKSDIAEDSSRSECLPNYRPTVVSHAGMPCLRQASGTPLVCACISKA